MPERIRIAIESCNNSQIQLKGWPPSRRVSLKKRLNRFFTTTAETIVPMPRPWGARRFAAAGDMNKAMAWTIGGMERRTRDAAEEAARRAGMRLDDWLDEAIAGQAALGQRPRPEDDKSEDERLAAAAGRLERIARQSTPGRESGPPRAPDAFDSAIERFEARLLRAEAQAARAFESVAQILERSNTARDADRQALIDA